jgi:DNA invertase Pin-like site-specific DNA recombinase
MEATTMRIGYSYARYSSPQQGNGDSIRRQMTGTVNWCKRHDVQLDRSRTYLDRGKSAYHGKHRQKGGALAAFVADVESGQVPRDSFLIIENLDRLSRENPWDAIPLLCSLVNAGITVASLAPSEMVYSRGSDMTALMLAVVEFSRGYSESAAKGHRMGEVWEQKRRAVRESGAIMTKKLPAWVEVRGGKLALIPDRAKIVNRIFDLALQGYGLSLIVKELTRDKVPTWGGGKCWSKFYVHRILSGRAAMGEFQPISHGKPDGDAIVGYFPPVIDESVWHQAKAALARRKSKGGPVGERVATLFSGLIRDAETGDRMIISWQMKHAKGKLYRRRILVRRKAMEGASSSVCFSHDIFEEAILKLLKEVNVADVIGKQPPSESASIAAELAVKESRSRQIEAELMNDETEVPALVRVLRSLNEECTALRKRLAEIRQRESNPLSLAWTEALSLIDVAQDEVHRLRLRELLRTLVEEILILVVPRGSHRFCTVQVFFRGDGRRDYLIHSQAKSRCCAGNSCAGSLPSDIAPDDLDLRRKRDVLSLTKMLRTIPIDDLIEDMRGRAGDLA